MSKFVIIIKKVSRNMSYITQSPTSVRIEASSVCQLKCPLCPTADGRIEKGHVGSGTLTLENFKKIQP